MTAKQLTDGNTTDDGYNLGQSASEKVALHGKAPTVQSAAMTAALTTVTFVAPGTPDYAIQAPTSTTPFGFVTADEARTVLSVIANLQTRVNELEAICEAKGLCAAN